jgi:hypothetical protein
VDGVVDADCGWWQVRLAVLEESLEPLQQDAENQLATYTGRQTRIDKGLRGGTGTPNMREGVPVKVKAGRRRLLSSETGGHDAFL